MWVHKKFLSLSLSFKNPNRSPSERGCQEVSTIDNRQGYDGPVTHPYAASSVDAFQLASVNTRDNIFTASNSR